MITSLNKIQTLQKQLLELPPITDDNKRKLDKKFRLEFNYNSNHIEGNTLTYSETELLLIFDKIEGGHEMRELEEMKAHDLAYNLIHEWASDKEHALSEQRIKELNKIILVKPFYKDAITPDGQATRRLIKIGDYKEHPNSVRLQNGEIFHYASPAETPIQMGELLQWYKTELEKKEIHPIELAALLHYKFVCIHPFDDGNGRISRLLMNYVLLCNNLPPVIIKTDDKKNYLYALNQADTGNIEAFVDYIAKQLIWSLETSIKASKGESIDELGDLDKRLELLKKSQDLNNKELISFNPITCDQIIQKNVLPIIEAIEIKLSGFDSFFNERVCFVKIKNKSTQEYYLLNAFHTVYNQLSNPFSPDEPEAFNEILIHISYTNFSLPNKAVQGGSYLFGNINFMLNRNNYQIIFNSNETIFSNVYSYVYAENEANAIAEKIAMWFLNTVEELSKK
jgi:Fic family protein